MKVFMIVLFCITATFASAQIKDDTTYLKELAAEYLKKMYVMKQFDSASAMLDKRLFLEMAGFYKNRNQGNLSDTVLYDKVKSDVTKYYFQLSEYSIDSLLGSTIEVDGEYKMGYVFYQFTWVLSNRLKSEKSMLVFIWDDNGKNWMIQDWTIKWIADQVFNKLI